jgi:predicted acyl esterase
MGWLRASHRKLDAAMTKPYRPYHSHDELQPLTPGAIYELDVEVWPTSITLPAGYTISLRIAGRDFQRPEALKDSSLSWRDKGAGPFLHNHPQDRGSETYAGKTTIYTGQDSDSFFLLPVIPS